jgi:protein SCO1/2
VGFGRERATDAEFTARPDARRFDLRGRVVSLDRGARQVTLAHDRIDGFMDAMTMPFAVKEGWAMQTMQPGDLVQATLVVDGARSWVEVAAVTRDPRGDSAKADAKGTWVPAAPGAPLPAVKLVDQDRRTFTFERYRGAPLVVTFAYTRCPLPEFCPLVMQRLAAIERTTAADPALAPARFLTVTLDPSNDTPARLREYGLHNGAGAGSVPFARWQLATGSADEIRKVAAFFGLDYYSEENGQVIHSLRTGVVAADGTLARVFEHNEWTAAEVVGVLEQLMRPAGAPSSRDAATPGS